jgi:hypothetical protein
MNLLKTIKNTDFVGYLGYGKRRSELEPKPKFLKSWSRDRSKIDRLRKAVPVLLYTGVGGGGQNINWNQLNIFCNCYIYKQ